MTGHGRNTNADLSERVDPPSNARPVDIIVNRAAHRIWDAVALLSRHSASEPQHSESTRPHYNPQLHHAPPTEAVAATATSQPVRTAAAVTDNNRIWITTTPIAVWAGSQWNRFAPYAKPVMRWFVIALAVWFAAVLALITLYRFVNPPFSNTMLFQRLSGQSIQHQWVPLEKISTNLIKAVVVAEDARFCQHWGIDLDAIQYAIEHAGDGTPRGASTISMQTAKNMFLWSSKSYIRKLLEVPVTLAMEIIWPKRRMLEIYLNIAEWGPGVFGIAAAARYHFGTKPSGLGAGASSLLAAVLPNPIVRNAGRPGPKTRAKARVVQARARNGGRYIGCLNR